MQRPKKVYKNAYYLVDLKDPSNPVVDSHSFKNADLGELAIKYVLKKPYVFVEKGETVIKYGLKMEFLYHQLGYRVASLSSYPPDIRMEWTRLIRFYPWGKNTGIDWYKKLDQLFPYEVFIYTWDPNKTPNRNLVDQRRRKVLYYKKLHTKYIRGNY